MSPVTAASASQPTASGSPKPVVEMPALARASADAQAGYRGSTLGLATAVPTLNAGKLVPGAEEWRAIERRVSSLRL
jgi:hypothetical protein